MCQKIWFQVFAGKGEDRSLKVIGWAKYAELENGTLIRLSRPAPKKDPQEFDLHVIHDPAKVKKSHRRMLFIVRGCRDINISDDPAHLRIAPTIFLIPYSPYSN